MRRLVLFDIDGTLLSCGPVPRQAAADAAEEAMGRPVVLEGYSMSGKTDPQILCELMKRAGGAPEAVQAALPGAVDGYLQRLRQRLRPEHVKVKPGVHALVEALTAREDVVLALLTGNVEPGARLKLGPAGLNDVFPFGAFGSDHADRYCLVPVAHERARVHTGRAFDGPSTVVIGDSIHDVLCGRSLGVRAVAVATGPTTADTLRDAGPHALLADFADTGQALSAILG